MHSKNVILLGDVNGPYPVATNLTLKGFKVNTSKTFELKESVKPMDIPYYSMAS